MTDVELFQQWMTEHGYNMHSLAKAMGIPYITLYHMIVRRNTMTEIFIVEFIKHFGCDEALKVFRTRLAPSPNV